MTKSDLRKRLMERPGVKRVIIHRDGTVESIGTMPRGDGGPKRWRRYEGEFKDLINE